MDWIWGHQYNNGYSTNDMFVMTGTGTFKTLTTDSVNHLAIQINNSDMSGAGSRIDFYNPINYQTSGTIKNFYDGSFWTMQIGTYNNPSTITIQNNNVIVGGTLTATNGVVSSSRNLLAPVAITVTASPFNFTNSAAGGTGGTNNVYVFVDGSGVTGSVAINGTTIFSALAGADATVPLQPGEYITVTYSIGTPVMKWKPF